MKNWKRSICMGLAFCLFSIQPAFARTEQPKEIYAAYQQVINEYANLNDAIGVYYTAYDINGDGIRELFIGYGGSMGYHIYGISEKGVIEYKEVYEGSLYPANVNDIHGFYEKGNELYVLQCSLGSMTETLETTVSFEARLFKVRGVNGILVKDNLYHKDHTVTMEETNTPWLEEVPQIASFLNGAKEVKLSEVTNLTLLDDTDEISVIFNGKELSFEQPPVLVDGRTLVPMRAIYEAFGADVIYDAKTKKITAVRGDDCIELWINKSTVVVNGAKIYLSTTIINQNGYTMVPLRFVSETLDATVEWDSKTKVITIKAPIKNK